MSSRRLIGLGSLLTLIIWTADRGLASEDPIAGPVVGFVPNAAGSILWPILGIPGAAVLGERLGLESPIRSAVVSPRQDYVLAVRSEDAQVILIDLNSGTRELTPVSGARPGGEIIAISPWGGAAGLYDHDTRVLQVLRGLPGTPEIAFEVDTSGIPGRATALAVSDDASMALLSFVGEGSDAVWVVNSMGLRTVSPAQVSSLTFILNRHDAIVTDDVADEAFLLLQADEAATRIPLLSITDGVEGMSGAAVSDDGRFAVVAGSKSGTVGVVDLQGPVRTVVSCECQPTGVRRLAGTAVFRLNEPPDGLVTVLDLSSGEPRILVIPPEPNVTAVGAEEIR